MLLATCTRFGLHGRLFASSGDSSLALAVTCTCSRASSTSHPPRSRRLGPGATAYTGGSRWRAPTPSTRWPPRSRLIGHGSLVPAHRSRRFGASQERSDSRERGTATPRSRRIGRLLPSGRGLLRGRVMSFLLCIGGGHNRPKRASPLQCARGRFVHGLCTVRPTVPVPAGDAPVRACGVACERPARAALPHHAYARRRGTRRACPCACTPTHA